MRVQFHPRVGQVCVESCTAITTGQGCAAKRVTDGDLVLEIVDRL